MAVAVICKLEHGRDTLDLNTGRYCLDDAGFMPPTTARSVTYGSLLAGAEPTRKRRDNRSWSFTVNINTTGNASKSEAERALRNLQSFLNRAGGSTPLYVAYRNYNDYSFEPYFGQFGAFSRYEVVHGTAEVAQDYNAALGFSNAIVRVLVTLTIKPQAVGLQQHSGKVTGGVFEYYPGSADGNVRGTCLSEATTNKHTNPIFGNSTYSTNWSTTTLDLAKNTDPKYTLFGAASARIQATGSTGDLYESLNVGNTNTHTFSFYAKMHNGGDPSGSIFVFYGTAQSTTVVSLGDGWYFCYASASGVAAGTSTGVRVSNNLNCPVYVDGFQAEELAYPTPLCYGDLLDCTWASTKHGSTSTRTDCQYAIPANDFLPVLGGYTIRYVWTPMKTDITDSTYLLDDTDGHTRVWIDSSQQYNYQTSTGSSIQSTAVTLTAGTPEVLHLVTVPGVATQIYRNGAILKTGSTTLDTALPTNYYIGSTAAARDHLNWIINGIATFQTSMSAAEVLADYGQVVQQATDGERIDPLPWVFTEDGDNVVDNDNDGTLFNYCVIGGLMGDDVEVAYKLDSSNSFILGPGVTFGSLPVPQYWFDKDILTDGNANSLLFENGTGTADTTANGDAVNRISLSTSISNIDTPITMTGARLLKEAQNVIGYFVGKDNGTKTNVQAQLALMFGDINEAFTTDWRTLATSNAFRPYITFELPLDFEDEILDSNRLMGFRVRLRRAAGSTTANFDVSHTIWLTNYAGVYTADVGASPVLDMAYGRERVLELVDDANATQTRGRRIFNRQLLIRPEMLNVLMMQHTFDNYAASKTTWTTGYNLEIEQFAVTPLFDIF